MALKASPLGLWLLPLKPNEGEEQHKLRRDKGPRPYVNHYTIGLIRNAGELVKDRLSTSMHMINTIAG